MNTEENFNLNNDEILGENSPEIENLEKESNLIDFNLENSVTPEIQVVKIDPQLQILEETKANLTQEISQLQAEKESLKTEIETLENTRNNLLENQTVDVESKLKQMIETSLEELLKQKQELQIAVEKLDKRKERINAEMKTTFAGVSQDLAIRVQGFKDYLVGSLQDLVAAAEQLEFANTENWESSPPIPQKQPENIAPQPQFSEQNFAQEKRKIKECLEQYRTRPDYYGAPWQLRRTFEPIHAERVKNWFFSQGGRGAIKSMGSRLQNILVASAIMSVLHKLYGNRVRTLILANTPERLGEWRRGLQDCLGISRSDFGPERGVVLFEQPEALIQKADRLRDDKLLPLVIIDETEDNINLALLQFPLWLAFAPEAQANSNYFY